MCDIVLLVYDQLPYTKGCVESILRNTGCPYRLLIIDNGSVNEETAAYLRALAAAHRDTITVYRIEKNIGYVGAVNFGLGKTTQDYVCVISNDTVVYPGWLTEMIHTARQDGKIGLVNPLWMIPKKYIGGRDRYISMILKRNAGRFIYTDWARGFCFLVTRQVITKISGLDKAYAPAYFDDWDYSIRAIEAGFRCARALGAFVWHYKNVTYGLAFSTEAMRLKGRIFYSRWGIPLRILLLHECPEPSQTGGYSDLVPCILGLQDRLTITTTYSFPDLDKHSNLIIRRIKPGFMFRIYILWQLLDNLRYARTRRYDMILCSSKLYRFLLSLRLIKNSYVGRLYEIKDPECTLVMPEISLLKRQKALEFCRQ